MDTFKIRAFMTAVKYKNFSKAAEEYSYTPSAFSHMAHALNEELGIVLFKRTPTGIELTAEGEKLYKKFEELIAAEDDLFMTAREMSTRKESEIRIGAYSSISRSLLPEIIKRFKELNPDIKISLIVSLNLRGWIEKDKADIVFADTSALRENIVVPIMEDPFVAVVPKKLFKDRSSVSIDELYSHPYIKTRENIYKDIIDAEKFKEIIPFTSEDDQAVISMVREGIGVAILPLLSCPKNTAHVKILKLDPPFSRVLGIAHKENPTANEEKFITFVKKHYKIL